MCFAGSAALAILSKLRLSICNASLPVRTMAQSVWSMYLVAATNWKVDCGTTWQQGNLPDTWSPVCVIGAVAPEKAWVVMWDGRIEDGMRFLVEVTM